MSGRPVSIDLSAVLGDEDDISVADIVRGGGWRLVQFRKWRNNVFQEAERLASEQIQRKSIVAQEQGVIDGQRRLGKIQARIDRDQARAERKRIKKEQTKQRRAAGIFTWWERIWFRYDPNHAQSYDDEDYIPSIPASEQSGLSANIYANIRREMDEEEGDGYRNMLTSFGIKHNKKIIYLKRRGCGVCSLQDKLLFEGYVLGEDGDLHLPDVDEMSHVIPSQIADMVHILYIDDPNPDRAELAQELHHLSGSKKNATPVMINLENGNVLHGGLMGKVTFMNFAGY